MAATIDSFISTRASAPRSNEDWNSRALPSAARSVELGALLDSLPHQHVGGPLRQRVSGLGDRPERSEAHDLLVVLPGSEASATSANAAAILSQTSLRARAGTSVFVTPSVRTIAGPLAARFWDHPSRDLDVVGVTGTNGKTTTVAMAESILRCGGVSVGSCGTMGAHIGDEYVPQELGLTFPEACTWQRLLARMRAHGCTTALCEVTSESVLDHRVDATRFRVMAYTNLSRDHLDSHGTMVSYAACKAKPFETLDADAVAVLSADEPACRALSTRARVLTFGFGAADIRPLELELGPDRCVGVLATPVGHVELDLSMPCRINVANAMAATGIAVALGLDATTIAAGLKSFVPVRGRLERVANDLGIEVRVDYAHTPDALECVLSSLRAIAPERRILVVFGCGGERDRGKRPLMARVASRWADVVIATSDNPRREDPTTILEEVAQGLDANARTVVDRREAIGLALSLAEPGDLLVIAGKGHETTQDHGECSLPFDDRDVVTELSMRRMLGRRAS